MESRRAQITVFVIIAIVIVAAVVLVFVFRDSIFGSQTGGEFESVYESFDNCVEQSTLRGLQIAGIQSGYVDVPEFEPGSDYAPFSSQLDFLGNPVPYWYYVSSNGVVKEQVPSISVIETQMEEYLELELERCEFNDFRNQGMIIDYSSPSVNVEISDRFTDVSVNMEINVERGDSRERKTNHEVRVDTRFGDLYNTAREIYSKQKQDAFLENYDVDVLYNYAPVTGTEISCSPITWNPQDVVNDLKQGISANVGALKIQGDYYDLQTKRNEYFVVDVESDYTANFIYNENWPTRIEVWPVENNVMVAEPIGLEQGLGILGFCYIPYHFVYDIYHPVLIQLSYDDEIFQFPVSVVIDKSVPREALEGSAIGDTDLSMICSNKNSPTIVNTYDSELNPIEARIDFYCLNERCAIGNTEVSGNNAVYSGNFPQCVNGRVVASAEGYVSQSEIISTNENERVDLILDKLYNLDLRILSSGSEVNLNEGELAIVRFESENYNTVVAYPQQRNISIAQGIYNVSVQVFSGNDLTIPASVTRECVDIPAKGILGVFGRTNEECFTIDIPAQEISSALTAGGKSVEIISEETDLRNSNEIVLNVPSLPRPNTLEQLQQNYEIYENNFLEVDFR